jgi:two-component system, OmpR family, KDP operon response regulator KdpE
MAVIAVAIGDDDARARIVRALSAGQYSPAEAVDSREAIRMLFDLRPDGIILDLDVGPPGGVELVRVLRAAAEVPIVALARDVSPELSVEILDVGADDIATLDTAPEEIVARMRAAIRRVSRPARPGDRMIVRTGGLVIDRTAQTVAKKRVPIALTRTEYRLLDALASRVGQVAPHRYLLSTVWGDAFVDDTHYLRVYIGYLRAKLEDDPARPRYLVNEWGLGYRLMQLPLDEPEPAPEPDASESEPTEPTAESGARRRGAGFGPADAPEGESEPPAQS